MEENFNVEEVFKRYSDIFKTIFSLPKNANNDLLQYFYSLLRVTGLQDYGWDPLVESRGILNDLSILIDSDIAQYGFEDPNKTQWRMLLLSYSHLIEMDAPYEILINLLRFKLGEKYSCDPFLVYETGKKKQIETRRLEYPRQKINHIYELSQKSDSKLDGIFEEFFDKDLRNAISHSDFIITDQYLRYRGGAKKGFMQEKLENINAKILKAHAFYKAFFDMDYGMRKSLGKLKNQGIHYDGRYKGIIEILVADDNLMNGIKIHWPNGCDSKYVRNQDGCWMENLTFEKNDSIGTMVGLYASDRSEFSPLVEKGSVPNYSPFESGETPEWKPA